MVEDLIAVAIGINQQTMVVVLFYLVKHPNEWSYSCPKSNYDVVLFEFSRRDLSWQNPSLSDLSLAFEQIMTAQTTVQSSFSYLVLHQFDKQINIPSLHPCNGVLPANYFIDISNKISQIQLQLEILDKLYDVAFVFLDKIEVFLIILLKLFKLLAKKWIVYGIDKGRRGLVDEEVIIYDEANVQVGSEELVEGEEVTVVVDCLQASLGKVVEHEGYVFLSILREDLDDVSLFYEFVRSEELQLGPVCPSVLVRRQFLHLLHPKLHFLVSIPQTQTAINFYDICLNDPFIFDKATNLVSPAIQIHFPISLRVHIISQSNLNKLFPSQHLQSLPQLPRSHTEMLAIRAIPKRIYSEFNRIIECEALLHELFPEGPHVVGRTALAGGRNEEDPDASVQGEMAVELLD